MDAVDLLRDSADDNGRVSLHSSNDSESSVGDSPDGSPGDSGALLGSSAALHHRDGGGAGALAALARGSLGATSSPATVGEQLERGDAVTKYLRHHRRAGTVVLALTVLVGYSCVYFVRMPVFAAGYADRGDVFGGSFGFKSALATGQILGYGLGKIPSLYLVPSMGRNQWGRVLLLLVLGAMAPMLLFAFVAVGEVQVLCVFATAFCLSPTWVLFVRYVEGREMTEAILSVSSLSFISASGAARSVGAALHNAGGVAVDWVPIVSCAISLPIFLVSLWVLVRTPPPSARDLQLRNARMPASREERQAFMLQWLLGIAGVIASYAVASSFRSYRDYYLTDLYRELYGHEANPMLFTMSELIVGITVLLSIAFLYKLQNNLTAFFTLLALIIGGNVVALSTVMLYQAGAIGGFALIAGTGVGVFVAVTPPGTLLWDRLMAASGTTLTSSFLIYLADAILYVATIVMLIATKDVSSEDVDDGANASRKLEVYLTFAYVSCLSCIVVMTLTGLYFWRRLSWASAATYRTLDVELE